MHRVKEEKRERERAREREHVHGTERALLPRTPFITGVPWLPLPSRILKKKGGEIEMQQLGPTDEGKSLQSNSSNIKA